MSKKEENAAPVPMKIDPPTRQLHTDDLDEQHFVELRQFLYKKQRQEHLTAKIKQRGGRAGSTRPSQLMSFNEDLGSPGMAKRIDREIMAEIGSNHSPGASNKP